MVSINASAGVTGTGGSISVVWSAVIAAIFAGVVVIFISLAIERLGGIKGGILGSMPTTIIPTSFGLWMPYRYLHNGSQITQAGVIRYQQGMMAVPLGMVLNSLYLVMWKYLPNMYRRRWPHISGKKLLFVVFITAISIWLLLAIGLVSLLEMISSRSQSSQSAANNFPVVQPDMFAPYFVATGAAVLILIIGIAVGWRPLPAPKGSNKTVFTLLIGRGVAAAVTIGVAVLIGQVSSYAGGVASIFPVIFTTSMIAVWVSSGEAVSSGAIVSLLLGSLSIVVFAIASAFLVPIFEYWAGTVLSWVISVVGVSIPSFFYLQWRRYVTHEHTAHKQEKIKEMNLRSTVIIDVGEDAMVDR